MFRLIIRFSLMFFTLTVLPSYALQQAAQSTPLPEKIHLQLKWFNQFQFAGYYAAIEKNYYAEEGLNVEIVERTLSKSVVKQVVSGEAEYGVGDSGLLSHYAQGEPVTALAAIFQHNPLVFFSNWDSGIISPFEVKGKRIMSDISSADEAPLRAMLVGAHVKAQDYTLVTQSGEYGLLAKKKVDVISGYLTDQTFYFKQHGVKVNIINPQNYGIDFYGDILFTSQNELRNHPDRVEKFRRASLKGWQYAMAHPEELIQIIRNKYHSKLSIEHLRFEAEEARKLILPDVIPLGLIQPERMKIVAKAFSDSGYNRPLTDTDLAEFIYTGKKTSLYLTESEKAFLAAHPILRLGVDSDFAPYEWVDESGNYVGMAADYMKLLEKKLGVRFEIIHGQPWGEILNMAKRDELELLACAVKTPERSQYLTFSEPFKSAFAVIIDNGQGGFIGSLNNLIGKRVAVEKGYFMQEMMEKNYPQIHLVLARNTGDALKLVLDGSADAYVGDASTANYTIKKNGFLSLRFSGQTEYRSLHSVATTKTHPELASIISKAMLSIPKEESDAIFNRWLGLKIESGVKSETLVKYGAGLGFLFLLFSYWVYRLRREIANRKAVEEQVSQLAFYDPLTKLPNRRLLNDRLIQNMAASKRSGCYGALMFLDLDNFKPLNDTHGHSIGDLLLMEAANRIKKCVREIDTVARFGGDEFVVLLSELNTEKSSSIKQASIIAEKIRATLSEPYLLPIRHELDETEIEHRCTASIGVAIFANHEGSPDDILKWADKAMYQAKEAGRNLIRFYD